MKCLVDLHTHSTNSDGEYSPEQLLEKIKNIAADKKVVWSITDHDSVGAYYTLKKIKIDSNIKIVIGCELSYNYEGASRDMLAYNFDLEKMKNFLDTLYCTEFKIKKQKEILKNYQKVCDKHGIKYDKKIEILEGKKGEAYTKMRNSILSHEENLQKYPFLKEGFYRAHFSNPKSEFYVSEVDGLPTLTEIVQIIHNMGGIAFVAHPFDYKEDKDKTIEYLNKCIDAGIDGVECYHYSIDDERLKILKEIKKKYNLLESGGTDFHGEKTKIGVKLFVGKDNVNVDVNDLQWLDYKKYIKGKIDLCCLN